jgi:hypothetical protein
MTGKGKHFGIVIGKTDTGLVLAGTATFNSATTLVSSVRAESLPYWIPVSFATKESTFDVVDRATGDDTTPKWINVRKFHSVDGENVSVYA